MRALSLLASVFLASCTSSGPPDVQAPPRGGAMVPASPADQSSADSEAVRKLKLAQDARTDELQRQIDELEERLALLESRTASGNPSRPRPARPRGPDPAVVYALDVTDNAYRGAKNAKVTIVKGFEFACPFCNKSRATLDELLKIYKGDIRIVYKSFVVHPQVAKAPAVAACAAGKQGKFHKMAEAIWKHGYDEYRSQRDPAKMDAANMRLIAKKYARLNIRKYDKALSDCSSIIAQDENDLRRVGVTGTPAFFINGRYLRGAQPLAKFQALIDEELALANGRINGRKATKKNYYEVFVYDKGKKDL